MSPDLVLMPSNIDPAKPWALRLRYHGPVDTDYVTLVRLTEEAAKEVVKAGAAFWLTREPAA